jgi:hypothetical protein
LSFSEQKNELTHYTNKPTNKLKQNKNKGASRTARAATWLGKNRKNGKLHKKREKVHKMINLSQIMITIKWKKGCKFAARIYN